MWDSDGLSFRLATVNGQLTMAIGLGGVRVVGSLLKTSGTILGVFMLSGGAVDLP